MNIKKKITMSIGFYYDFFEYMDGKYKNVRQYMINNGWKDGGGYIQGDDAYLCNVYKKIFTSAEQMNRELDKIESHFR